MGEETRGTTVSGFWVIRGWTVLLFERIFQGIPKNEKKIAQAITMRPPRPFPIEKHDHAESPYDETPLICLFSNCPEFVLVVCVLVMGMSFFILLPLPKVYIPPNRSAVFFLSFVMCEKKVHRLVSTTGLGDDALELVDLSLGTAEGTELGAELLVFPVAREIGVAVGCVALRRTLFLASLRARLSLLFRSSSMTRRS